MVNEERKNVSHLEGLDPEVIEMLQGHKESSTYLQYARHQKNFLKFCETRQVEPLSEPALLNFFGTCVQDYAPSTCWSIYSAIAHWYLLETGQKLQVFPRIQTLLKKHQSDRAPPKKAKVFEPDTIEKILFGPIHTETHNLSKKMVAVLGFYGTLRRADMKRVCFGGVRANPDGSFLIVIEDPSKNQARLGKGHTFNVPHLPDQQNIPAALLRKYMSFCRAPKPEDQLLRNWNEKGFIKYFFLNF